MNDAEDEENMRCLHHCPFPRHVFLILLFCSAISTGSSAKCSAPIASASAYRECACEPVAGDASVTIKCTSQEWTNVPSLAGIYGDAAGDQSKPTVVALSIVNSELALLNQDDFKEEGEHIQALDLSGNNIVSINVNAFRKLESKLYQLKLTRNLLTAIPHWALTYLRQLQYLDLQENRIAEIKADTFHEAQLKNLRYLHLDKNHIALLPKGALHTLPLQVLTLSSNRISEIEKESMPTTLWFLDLKNNLMEEIPYLALKDLSSLKTLDLESNNISILAPNAEVRFENEVNLLLSNNKIRALGAAAFGSFTRLIKLDLSYNQISSVHETAFASVATLIELDLSYNSLVHIPQETFTPFAKSLKSLNLEENDLHALPIALKQLKAIEKLNLNSNKLNGLDKDVVAGFRANLTELFVAFNRLSRIPSDIFDGMTQLRHLDLSKNRIKRVENMAFGAYGGAGTSLVRLNLAGNQIEEIVDPGAFLYLSSLAYLDLNHNKIKRLSKASLERLEGLESLFLQNNALTEFPRNALSSLNKLRYLLLDNNKIGSVPDFAFQWLVRLERLSLSRNQLRSIGDKTFHVSSTANLKSLNLEGNRIELLRSNTFSNLENLEQLLLNANRIATVQSRAFHHLPNLRQLDLSHNHISQLLPHAFVDLPLEVLVMSHNRLQAIDESAFFELSRLTHFDLSHNFFAAFDLSVLGSSAHRLKHLDLSNNALARLNLELAKRTLIRLNLRKNLLHFVDDNLLQGFNQLTTVDLAENNLIEIQEDAFKGCPQLERIVLSGNDLGRLWKGTFTHQKLIHLLDLSENFLDNLEADVFGEDNVLSLVLKGNNFSRIPTEALTSISGRLLSLDLSHNAIRSLDSHNFKNLKRLSWLDFSHNKIDALEEEVFHLLPRLKYLDLSHNPITTWSPHAFTGVTATITSLNLAHTGLFSLPRIRAPNLKRLNVSHNHLYEVSTTDVQMLKRVARLDISNNNLHELKPEVLVGLPDLKDLNISGNDLRSLDDRHFRQLDQLETLSLSNMRSLIHLPGATGFARLRNLKNLGISGLPKLSSFNVSSVLRYLPPLKVLQIEIKEAALSTQLSTVDMRMLRSLTISGKALKTIETAAFERLRGFRIELSIQGTSLSRFPSDLFDTMTRISFLSLSIVDSQLENISPFEHTKAPLLAPGTILESFNFQGNPLRCDCRMRWIREWIAHVTQHGALASAALSTLNRTNCVDSSGEQRNLLEAFDPRSVQTGFLGNFGRRTPLRCDTSSASPHMPLATSTVFWTSLAGAMYFLAL